MVKYYDERFKISNLTRGPAIGKKQTKLRFQIAPAAHPAIFDGHTERCIDAKITQRGAAEVSVRKYDIYPKVKERIDNCQYVNMQYPRMRDCRKGQHGRMEYRHHLPPPAEARAGLRPYIMELGWPVQLSSA